jgi:hypothetical protein
MKGCLALLLQGYPFLLDLWYEFPSLYMRMIRVDCFIATLLTVHGSSLEHWALLSETDVDYTFIFDAALAQGRGLRPFTLPL